MILRKRGTADVVRVFPDGETAWMAAGYRNNRAYELPLVDVLAAAKLVTFMVNNEGWYVSKDDYETRGLGWPAH